jgi:hypothetical protein
VSPEISRWYGENPWAFEAQSRILTQRFAQRTEPIDRPYREAYVEILAEVGIAHLRHNVVLSDTPTRRPATPELGPAREQTQHPVDEEDEEDENHDEDDMQLFLFAIMWLVFCLFIHIVFVQPWFI